MSKQKPVKVAIIGGGCASIAAAFELSRPEHQGKYQVTVYQLGWRLGGKGASGRGPADRIEEHGLHVWMGFYDNAFRLLRECYAELGRNPKECRIADWRDAFVPEYFVGLTEPVPTGDWRNIISFFPPVEGLPGDPVTENDFSISTYMVRAATLLRSLLLASQMPAGAPGGRPWNKGRPDSSPPPENPLGTRPEDLPSNVARLLKYGLLATTAGLIEAAGILDQVSSAVWRLPDNILLRLLEGIAATARRQLETLADTDDELRRLWEVIDLALAAMLGIMRFDLMNDPRGLDAINDYDYREWLKLNGASDRSLQSAIIRGSYDLAFAYEDGDFKRPRLAAGQALRNGLRMFFTYRGALFWKMRAGMGDVVFAPFYEVLKRRGVAFRFFHRLKNVQVANPAAPGESPYVEALQFDVQAEIEGGGEYQPLIDVRGLPCWPSQPDYGQLVDGRCLRQEGRDFESHWDKSRTANKTLRVIDDFDFVVLGVGLGAIPYVCRPILQRDKRWRDMVTHVKTTPTQAFQLWLREDMEALGWTNPPVCLSGFAQPFDTWADMRQLLPEENWTDKPAAIAYFCSVLSDVPEPDRSAPSFPHRRQNQVRKNAIRFLNEHVRHLWPKAAAPRSGSFRWELLMAPNGDDSRHAAGRRDESSFDSQFWVANVNPSDRYVLTLPGSIKYRISPLDDTYDNLTLAGDWTNCGLNAGCVEAAFMSGRLAAHALSALPRLEEITGYDHP